MSNRSLVLVLMICGLLISSLIVRDGKLLLLAIPFLAYLIVGAIQAPLALSLVARRNIDKPGVSAQQPSSMQVVVHNQGQALLDLSLSDAAFPSLTILDGQARQRIALPAGASTELRYVFKAQRGVYAWRSVQIVASDPFGLFELRKDIPAGGEVIVRPASMNLKRIDLRPQTTLHAPGPIPMRLGGSSTDFLGIREYRSGDSLRRLNWRQAARHPRQLFTNEYEREEIAEFGLILDARTLTKDSALEETLFESSISAITSLSELFLKQGNRVALLVFGETVDSLFPGYGKKQLNQIMRTLARARLGSHLSLGYLEYFPTRLFASRSILIVFSMIGTYDHDAYARLRSFGYEILLISPDPVDAMSRRLPLTPINALAVRAARLERNVQLKQLMKLGIQVIDWQVHQPLGAIVQQAARNISRRRNT